MMLAARGLRVVPVTIHTPLKAVPGLLSIDLIVETAEVVVAALTQDFGIAQPRLAVAGLNPHAGEGGMLGDEEETIITPAVMRLRNRKYTVSGPAAADSLFHEAARREYDAALCMYHDQALIPLKTIDFWSGVNITLGLPIVRTSPDHGTAFALAGSGNANADSMIAAIEMAGEISANRRTAAG
jgi:4-hydroxythreonine-4-phosphate dehydrogenase